ncbi:MAG: helix-turn-helix transcriptional regulator [Clostridia bacterium]|nr:helix-turn-helix transcriptional regulator [Clostridia bacterium]
MFKTLSIGERLCNLRQSRKMTQKDLATIMNVSDKTISKWETGENEPDIASIKKITEVFEVSLDLVLNGVPSCENDEKALKLIQDTKEYGQASKAINDFYKNECPYQEIESSSLFIIIENKPYAILDCILLLDDYDFFCKVNERFSFIRYVPAKPLGEGQSVLDESPVSAHNEILCHPYQPTLKDIELCNDIGFYENVKAFLEKKYEKRPEMIGVELSACLENLRIEDVSDDRVYLKILFLIDNGAVYHIHIPYEQCAGYRTLVDRARTDLVYKLCNDNLYYTEKIEELERRLESLESLKKDN